MKTYWLISKAAGHKLPEIDFELTEDIKVDAGYKPAMF